MNEPSISVRRFLAILVVVLATLAVVEASPARAATDCGPSSSWGTNRPDLASQVLSLINQYRAGMGLSRLVVSSPLTASAEWKSLHMAGYGYFDHNDQGPPISRSAYQRVTDCGYGGSAWGENIAWGSTSAQSVVSGWLRSSGHKANIENPNFRSTGVGVAANASGVLYWTQSFGNDVAPARSSPALGLRARRAYVRAVTGQGASSRLTASVAFVRIATGRLLTAGSVRCRAEVDGKRLRVLANAFKARAARCAWRVPDWARGRQVTGIVAVQPGEGAALRLFVRKLG